MTVEMDSSVGFGNSSLNNTYSAGILLTDKKWRATLIVIYCVLLLFGFFENAGITGYLIKNRNLLKPTNILILVLALSDMFLCAFTVPAYFTALMTASWMFGKTVCKIYVLTFNIPLFMSAIMVFMIAIHRYRLTTHLLQRRLSNSSAVCLIIAAAIICILIKIPTMIHLDSVHWHNVSMCEESWAGSRLYLISTAVLRQLPLFGSLLAHVNIHKNLYHSTLDTFEKQQKQKTNFIILAITLSFLFCRLPFTIFWVVLEFDQSIIYTGFFRISVCVLMILAVCPAVINPFLYAWLNNNFTPRRRRTSTGHIETPLIME